MSIYAQPYRPSLATASAIAGIGDGLEKYSLLKEKEEGDLRLAERKAQLSRDEMREKLQLEWENKKKEWQLKQDDFEARLGRMKEYVGVGEKPTEEQFSTTYGGTDKEYDELGQQQKVVDKEAYNRARRDWGQKGIMAEAMATDFGKSDDAAKAVRTSWITEEMQRDGTQEGIRRYSMAEQGKQRNTQGKSGRLDDWGGEVEPTDLTRAEEENQYASARHHDASAGHQGALAAKARNETEGGGGKPTTMAEAVKYAQRAQSAYDKAVDQAVKVRLGGIAGNAMEPKERVKEVEDDPQVKTARTELDQANTWLEEFRKKKVPGVGDAPARLGSLPTGAKQIGTYKGKPVYQTPDGRKFVKE